MHAPSVTPRLLLLCIAALTAKAESSRLSSHDASALPVSFGPSSAPHVVAIYKIITGIHGDDARIAALLSRQHTAAAGTTQHEQYAAACEAFLASANARTLTYHHVEALVAAWLADNTDTVNAAAFVDEVLATGLPVMGRRDQSKVIGGRAAKKWLKATKKVREAFAG